MFSPQNLIEGLIKLADAMHIRAERALQSGLTPALLAQQVTTTEPQFSQIIADEPRCKILLGEDARHKIKAIKSLARSEFHSATLYGLLKPPTGTLSWLAGNIEPAGKPKEHVWGTPLHNHKANDGTDTLTRHLHQVLPNRLFEIHQNTEGESYLTISDKELDIAAAPLKASPV